MRIAKVVGLATAEDEPFFYVVLEELAGDRQLAIAIGQPEAFNLAAHLGGIAWPRPMPTSSPLGWCRPLAGGSGRCGSIGWWRRPMSPPSRWKAQLVDARPSDALNLATLVQAPILVTPEVLQEAEARRTGDSPEAARLRRALVVPAMTIQQEGR